MSDTPDPQFTVPARELIDRLCDEFEAGWLDRRPILLEDLVRCAPESVRVDLFHELLPVERAYRERAGQPITADEARARFGGLGPWADGLIRELIAATTVPGFDFAPELPTPFTSPLVPSGEPVPGCVGGFQVVGRLGEGGMGVVYRTDDPLGGRQVAVKVMRPQYAADPVARERFLREARSAMAVENDHVVPVYQVGVDGITPFLVMPVLKGESLEARLRREPLPPLALVFKVGREVALGLAAAHSKGLVHRDVKPANTWLDGEPFAPDLPAQVRRVKVLDFGLARAVDATDGVSVTGSVVGTPAYMAPEQARGEKVDPRADLFGLGAILYRMATGKPAFAGPTITAVLTAIATHIPPPADSVNPAVPAALSALIGRLLEKVPGDRPQSAHEVVAALATLEEGRPPNAPPAKSRNTWGVGAAIAALLLLTGLGAWYGSRPTNGAAEPVKGGNHAPEPPPRVSPGPPTPYKGSVDLLVIRHNLDGAEIAVPLSDPRAMPLRTGDHVKVIAEVEPPAYLYLFWIDETGAGVPVFPWRLAEWGTRPTAESAVARVEVKDPKGNWLKVTGDAEAMETVLMLARPTPLDVPEPEVRRWFAGLQSLPLPQLPTDQPARGEKARVWFEGFDLVGNDPARRAVGFDRGVGAGLDPAGIGTPLGLQSVLRGRIGDRVGFSRAVSFARLGKKPTK